MTNAISWPCVNPTRNSAHFSGVSAGNEVETKTCTTSPVDAVTGPPFHTTAARAETSIRDARESSASAYGADAVGAAT